MNKRKSDNNSRKGDKFYKEVTYEGENEKLKEKTLNEVYTQRNVLAQVLSMYSEKVFIRNKDSEYPILCFKMGDQEITFHIPISDWNEKLLNKLKKSEEDVEDYDGSMWKEHSYVLNKKIEEKLNE